MENIAVVPAPKGTSNLICSLESSKHLKEDAAFVGRWCKIHFSPLKSLCFVLAASHSNLSLSSLLIRSWLVTSVPLALRLMPSLLSFVVNTCCISIDQSLGFAFLELTLRRLSVNSFVRRLLGMLQRTFATNNVVISLLCFQTFQLPRRGTFSILTFDKGRPSALNLSDDLIVVK